MELGFDQCFMIIDGRVSGENMVNMGKIREQYGKYMGTNIISKPQRRQKNVRHHQPAPDEFQVTHGCGAATLLLDGPIWSNKSFFIFPKQNGIKDM